MPQRFLRPGITTSDRWNAVSWEAQSFFIRILTLVDDFGRYDGRPAILHGQCFALREDINPLRTAALRSELHKSKLIQVYVHEGKEYLQVLQWQERARTDNSRYPDPQDSAADCCDPQDSASSIAIASIPSPSPLEPKAPRMRGEEKDNKPTDEYSIRIANMFHRRLITSWSSKEIEAYKKIRKNIDPEEFEIVESYYSKNWPPTRGVNILRTSPLIFLNNYQGEVDRARAAGMQPQEPTKKPSLGMDGRPIRMV